MKLKPWVNEKNPEAGVLSYILPKEIHFFNPKKSSLLIHGEFNLCVQISFKEGYERFYRKKDWLWEVFHRRLCFVFIRFSLRRSSLQGLTGNVSFIGFVLSNPTDLVGDFVQIRVFQRILANKFFRWSFLNKSWWISDVIF